MSDLDANGNVNYSNIPSFSVRRKQTNATDIRRSIGTRPETFIFSDVPTTLGANFQTIADLTGKRTCNEGIEIVVHGATHPVYQKYRSRMHIVKISGTTGTAAISNETFIIERTPQVFGSLDVNDATSESIFIPTTDPTRVCLGKFPNAFSGLDTNAQFRNVVEVKIK